MVDIADYFDRYDDDLSSEVFCKYCDAGPLDWVEVRTNPGNRKAWRLVDERGRFHACPAFAPALSSVDDFEDLS